jgi:hypothetical protein
MNGISHWRPKLESRTLKLAVEGALRWLAAIAGAPEQQSRNFEAIHIKF